MHERGRLGGGEFADQCANGYGSLSIDICGANFVFGGRSHDIGHYFGNGVNGSIEPQASSGRLFRIGRTVAEKIMATGTAADMGSGKVRGVAIDV